MNPYISPEGSYEIGSVLWSTFRQFSWNWLISFFVFFLKLYIVLGAQMWMCLIEPTFLGKLLIGQKWPKMVVAHVEPISTQVFFFFVFIWIMQTPVTWLLIVANWLVAIWSVRMPRMWSTLDIDSECVTLYVTSFLTFYYYFVISLLLPISYVGTSTKIKL